MVLIDRNHLLQLAKKNAPFIYSILAPIAMLCPTVEAEPVRHGRWVRMDDTFTRWKCSECGTIEDHDGYAYCHCGAKMDGGADE